MKLFSANPLMVMVLALFAAPVLAAPEGDITYTIKAKDTLYDIAGDYLVDRGSLGELKRLNKIRNPRRLRIGRSLAIPRRLLKYRPVGLVLRSYTGAVTLRSGSRNIAPSIGLKLREGTEISTGRNSFVSIAGDGNSSVAIPSNSRARIVDARRYLINNQIDIQLQVLRGRGEVVAPKVGSDGRYRVGTPLTVTAVRGTEFRVAFDPDSGQSLTEVLEGEVSFAAGGQELATAAGFGVSAAKETLGEREALLAAPELIDPGQIQTSETVNFAIEPITGAAGYRTQISKDAGFVEVVSEVVGEADQVQFKELEDGRYFVRSRGISPVGLEGFAKAFSFRRKKVSVGAAAEPSQLDDAFRFAWLPGDGDELTHAFQLWQAEKPGTLLVDKVAMRETTVFVSSLEPGTYKWRVASFQIDEGDVIKVWGSTQEFSVSE